MTGLHGHKNRLHLDSKPFLSKGFKGVHCRSDMTFRLTYEEMP